MHSIDSAAKAAQAQIARDIINAQVSDPGTFPAHIKRCAAALYVDQGVNGEQAAHLALTVR